MFVQRSYNIFVSQVESSRLNCKSCLFIFVLKYFKLSFPIPPMLHMRKESPGGRLHGDSYKEYCVSTITLRSALLQE